MRCGDQKLFKGSLTLSFQRWFSSFHPLSDIFFYKVGLNEVSRVLIKWLGTIIDSIDMNIKHLEHTQSITHGETEELRKRCTHTHTNINWIWNPKKRKENFKRKINARSWRFFPSLLSTSLCVLYSQQWWTRNVWLWLSLFFKRNRSFFLWKKIILAICFFHSSSKF